MKINEKIFSVPPYVSTSWHNVKAIRMEGTSLVVLLSDGGTVTIPGLSDEIIMAAFEFHQKALETKVQNTPSAPFAEGFIQQADQTIRFGLAGMEALGNAMQHNFEMRNSSDLPQEILKKVEAVAKVIAPDLKADLPKPEPHCNCPHCQIARAMQRGLGQVTEESPPYQEELELVPAEDLQFEEWRIEQTGTQLYTVINKIDSNERYSVFLGSPVGCTCGKQGCDHILAVLRS